MRRKNGKSRLIGDADSIGNLSQLHRTLAIASRLMEDAKLLAALEELDLTGIECERIGV